MKATNLQIRRATECIAQSYIKKNNNNPAHQVIFLWNFRTCWWIEDSACFREEKTGHLQQNKNQMALDFPTATPGGGNPKEK